jgi:hypothetical protein
MMGWTWGRLSHAKGQKIAPAPPELHIRDADLCQKFLPAGKTKNRTTTFDHFPTCKPTLAAGKGKNGITKQSKSWYPKNRI